MARRRFPSTCFIRRRDQIDYLQEPDVFHDIFGHVPLLMKPVFGDYMQAYGRGGLKALSLGHSLRLARLYWYTVEFGLTATPEGLRIYGSGILSSAGESVYCLNDPRPHRIGFDLRRVMRTRSHIDRFQGVYFVIDDFESLFATTESTISRVYSQRPSPILRQYISPLRRCPTSKPIGSSTKIDGSLRLLHPSPTQAKKMGRNCARPKFREETPRRRTVRPQPAIVTALHNLVHHAAMSSSFFEEPGIVEGFGSDQ